MCKGGDICPCYTIFQSATSATPTDGLMRGTHVLSCFLQSAHSDVLTGGNYGQKILRRLRNRLDTQTQINLFGGSKLHEGEGSVDLIGINFGNEARHVRDQPIYAPI